MRDFIVTSLGASSAVGESGCKPTFETKEANVENITVLDVMNATSNDAVAKLVKIWENKNAQRALRGAGLSTMALSLAACGGSSDPAPAEEVVEEVVVTPVALALTTGNDIFDANDFTTAADTITGDQDAYNAADVIAEATAGDGDTLTITTDADITATPTVVGIENIVFNGEFFAAAGAGLDVDLDGVAGGTVTINHVQVGSAMDTSVITNANAVTVVAGTNVDDISVTMNEDAGTVVNAGDATAVAITSEAGADQVATLIANGDLTVTLADTADTMTDLNITATAASVVTVVDNANLDTITGDANTTIDVADLSDFDGFTITGAAGVVGAAGAITEDFTGIATTITFDADSSGTVADGANIVIDGTSGTDLILDTDDGDDATDSEATINVTVNEVDTTAANTITLDNNGFGADLISTINISFAVAQGAANAFVIDSDAEEITVNASGAVAVEIDTANLEGVLNASAMTGALTASARANLLTITGGSGDDEITAVTAAAYILDGGLGTDTLNTAADNTTGSFTGFEILNITTGDDFMASQLSGETLIITSAGGITVDVATGGAGGDAIDIASIDFSGLTFADNTDTLSVDLGNIDAAELLAGQAITYVGSNTAINDVTGGANGDTITGGALADVIDGGAGADTIVGGAGADAITGGTGADTMTGGAGADDFVIATGDTGITVATADTITDFVTASDQLDTVAIDVYTEVDGAATADFADFLVNAAADFLVNITATAGDVTAYVEYNMAGTGNTYVVIDEDASGTVNAGDTLFILSGLDAAADLAAADFI